MLPLEDNSREAQEMVSSADHDLCNIFHDSLAACVPANSSLRMHCLKYAEFWEDLFMVTYKLYKATYNNIIILIIQNVLKDIPTLLVRWVMY